jgi:protease-4
MTPEDINPEDKSSEDTSSEGNSPEDTGSENTSSEDKSSENTSSEGNSPEGVSSEDTGPVSVNPEKYSEKETSESFGLKTNADLEAARSENSGLEAAKPEDVQSEKIADLETPSSETIAPETINSEIINSEIINSEIINSETIASETIDSETVSPEVAGSEKANLETPGSENAGLEAARSENTNSKISDLETAGLEAANLEAVNSGSKITGSVPESKKLKNESFNMRSNASSSQVPPKRKRSHLSFIAVVLALIAVIGLSMVAIYFGFGFGGDLGTSDKVAVIYVQGTMLTGNVPSGLGYATSEEISENIREAVKDENVKAIVLRINSGGGSPAAAQEIVEEIEKAQKAGVPVVISMGDTAASAAYYISAPADYIIANPSTSTGSIGVIWTFQNLSAYYNDEGVEYYIAKSGEMKDMGGSWRGLTDEEKEYADKVILETYEEFITQVAEGRNMSRGEVKELADGRIYTGLTAKKVGLVDELGNLYDAIDKAAELGGIQGEPRVVYMNQISLSKLLLGSETSSEDVSLVSQELVSYFEDSPYGQILA